MMQLEYGGRRHPIPSGETVIGSAPGSALTLEGIGVQPRHAILQGSPAGAAIRSAGPDAPVLVNGVPLGTDPTPVLHGDKIHIGEYELLAVDPDRLGRTRLFNGGAFNQVPTAGRLVSLTDGREYQVGERLVFGRDASADVVVTGSEVSRQHAEIRPTAEGYLLTDASANGTYVNGVRIAKTRLLSRADVIRIGSDEFRFYASEPEGPAAAPEGASFQLSDTMHDIPVAELHRLGAPPAAPATAEPAPLATFLVRSGSLKGQRLAVRAPVANIGRADDNEVVIADPSVSAVHAKLLQRGGLWILTDLNSTNGTYVDGELVTQEAPLIAGSTVRLGDVTTLFDPRDTAAASAPDLEPREPPTSWETRRPRPPRITPPRHRGVPGWLIAGLLAAAAGVAAAFLLFR